MLAAIPVRQPLGGFLPGDLQAGLHCRAGVCRAPSGEYCDMWNRIAMQPLPLSLTCEHSPFFLPASTPHSLTWRSTWNSLTLWRALLPATHICLHCSLFTAVQCMIPPFVPFPL